MLGCRKPRFASGINKYITPRKNSSSWSFRTNHLYISSPFYIPDVTPTKLSRASPTGSSCIEQYCYILNTRQLKRRVWGTRHKSLLTNAMNMLAKQLPSSKLTKLSSSEMTDQWCWWSLNNFHYRAYDWSKEWEGVNRYLPITISLIDALGHASMQSM